MKQYPDFLWCWRFVYVKLPTNNHGTKKYFNANSNKWNNCTKIVRNLIRLPNDDGVPPYCASSHYLPNSLTPDPELVVMARDNNTRLGLSTKTVATTYPATDKVLEVESGVTPVGSSEKGNVRYSKPPLNLWHWASAFARLYFGPVLRARITQMPTHPPCCFTHVWTPVPHSSCMLPYMTFQRNIREN